MAMVAGGSDGMEVGEGRGGTVGMSVTVGTVVTLGEGSASEGVAVTVAKAIVQADSKTKIRMRLNRRRNVLKGRWGPTAIFSLFTTSCLLYP